jgi:hypothetical protein
MFLFLKWIREWREQRQISKEIEAHEAERRIQRKKRDDQQAQALLLAQYELQRTMDPLVAAQVYNNRFCPLISQLPEELLLCIIDFLCDDAVALHCLRIVSRTFLRILDCQSVVWRDSWYRTVPLYTRGHSFYLHNDSRLQFRRLLQRDGRCDDCKRWNEAHKHKLFDECQFLQNCDWKPDGTCNILSYRTLYCFACHSLHDAFQFSTAYQWSSSYQLERRCLGQQGTVQLCDHIQITWARIKDHIDNWRQQQCGVGNWQACLDNFIIECYDSSHDTRCTASEAPTWPRARLGIAAFQSDTVVLNLEWTPHARIDALALIADGRIPAPDLRALFQKLRSLGPADTLCPPCRPGALPEMAFFSLWTRGGHFLYYKTGEDDKTIPSPASFALLPPLPWLIWHRGHGRGCNGTKLDIRPHHPRGTGGTGISSQCLVIRYEKDIMICKTTAMADPSANILPTHDWLHAMDPQTYSRPQASNIRPQCRDVGCTNYYRRQKSYSCFAY